MELSTTLQQPGGRDLGAAGPLIGGVDFTPHTIPPLPPADSADAVVRPTAVAVVADVVGQHVVSLVGKMPVLDYKVDLDTVVVAPRLPKICHLFI